MKTLFLKKIFFLAILWIIC